MKAWDRRQRVPDADSLLLCGRRDVSTNQPARPAAVSAATPKEHFVNEAIRPLPILRIGDFIEFRGVLDFLIEFLSYLSEN